MTTAKQLSVSETFNANIYSQLVIQTYKWLACTLFFIITGNFTLAQDQLLGLTSTGGPGAVGTAFSIKTDASAFKVEHSFFNGGTNPFGDLIKGTDGNFYGMTQHGGKYKYGTIFKMAASGVITVLRNLNTNDGTNPLGSLLQASDGNFYGMANQGGANNCGTIFRISSSGTFKVLRNITLNDGRYPFGSLTQSSNDGYLYGMTYGGGGDFGGGSIFRITISGSNFEILHQFSSQSGGAFPQGRLIEGIDGAFYGMTHSGDSPSTGEFGSIFRITSTKVFKLLHAFAGGVGDGSRPSGSLVRAIDNNFYGVTSAGGAYDKGVFFKITPGGSFTLIKSFYEAIGTFPFASVVEGSAGTFYGMTLNGGNNGYGTIFKIKSSAAITVLHHFIGGSDGANPHGSLYKNSDGYLYGMTRDGGTASNVPGFTGNGVIFKIDTSSGSAFSILASLPDGTKGMNPQKSLIVAKDGNYYGTTLAGGKLGAGTVFKLSTAGVYTTLNSFTPAITGGNPRGSLMEASDGNFYGTTSRGGNNNYGTLFKMTPSGTISVLYHFSSLTGAYPECKLLQGIDGSFYGTTRSGGTDHHGTIFKFTLPNTYTVLKHLDLSTGYSPTGDLIQTGDGVLYGMTSLGNISGYGCIFRIGSDNVYIVIKSFDANTGHNPYGSLVYYKYNGTLYGMTSAGGASGGGTIFQFQISTKAYHVRYNFPAGSNPKGNLVEDSEGTLYGMTSAGGQYNGGTIFKLLNDHATFSTLYSFNPTINGSTPLGSLLLRKAPSQSGTLEAEQAVLSGAVVASTQTGYTGTGYADYINPSGDYIEWTVNATAAGSFSLNFRYANGGTTNRPLELRVNGAVINASLAFNPTGGWTTWLVSSASASLNAGANKVRLTTIGSNGPNLDNLSFSSGSSIQSLQRPVPGGALLPVSDLLKAYVAPNPVADNAKLIISASSGLPINFKLIDMLGRSYKSFKLVTNGPNAFDFSVSGLPPGSYIIILKQGNLSTQARLIVERK